MNRETFRAVSLWGIFTALLLFWVAVTAACQHIL